MTISEFFSALRAPSRAARTALHTSAGPLSYADLSERVRIFADALSERGASVVASLLDNGGDWIVLDLACLSIGVAHLPLPLFFSPDQLSAALHAAAADVLVGPVRDSDHLATLGFDSATTLHPFAVLRRTCHPTTMASGTAKITFTSGSTGIPKGVCLTGTGMLAVAASLVQATAALGIERHMTALPLPVLLENIAGVYAPLIQGASIDVRPLAAVGLRGSSQFDPAVFHTALVDSRVQSVIVLPQMLRTYTRWLQAQDRRAPADLRLMAVGGAAVGEPLLRLARAAGLPAYEGYGLSEAASVQTLNLPGADCPGSAGRPLPHARVRIAADGEIEVAGSVALAYLGNPPRSLEWWPTGDLGHIDSAGYLHVQGRKKNVLITGFGRNVSPEWIELALTGQPEIRHAVVLGDGQPSLGAVIWAEGKAGDQAIGEAIERVNRNLPDYARVGPWLHGRADFSAASGLATPNGRPRRDTILLEHADLFQGFADHHAF